MSSSTFEHNTKNIDLRFREDMYIHQQSTVPVQALPLTTLVIHA